MYLAMADLTNRPADPDARQIVLARAETLAMRLRGTDEQLASLATESDLRLEQMSAEASDLRASLGQLAAGIAAGFNSQQVLGVDASGAQGQPMFGLGATGLASDFALLLGSGSQLATGLAMTAQAAPGNAGDLSVASFSATGPAPMSTAPVTLVFNADGSFDVSGGGTGDPAGVAWTPGSVISFNGWAPELRGAPQAGDRIEVLPTLDPATDNRNAQAMVLLSDRPLVDGRTLTDAFASMLGEVGRRTRSAEASEAVSTRLLAEAGAARAKLAGVSLDEEAARLLQYQQMYQVAARVIQAAQSMFDTLLSATAR